MSQQKIPITSSGPFSVNAGFSNDNPNFGRLEVLRGAILLGDSANAVSLYTSSLSSFQITEGLCVYLRASFENEAITQLSLESSLDGNWWPNYPQLREYRSGSSKLPKNQTALYSCVANVTSSPTGRESALVGYGNGLYIYRYIFNDLILFRMCDGFIFMPSPSLCPNRPV